MKGGRKFGRWGRGGEVGALSPSYYRDYLEALRRVFEKEVRPSS